MISTHCIKFRIKSNLYLIFHCEWVRVCRLCSGLWRLLRRQWKSVTLCWTKRKTDSHSHCTANMVTVLFSSPQWLQLSFYAFIRLMHDLQLLSSLRKILKNPIFSLQVCWKHITCLFRTVKVYRRFLIRTAVVMCSKPNPGLWNQCAIYIVMYYNNWQSVLLLYIFEPLCKIVEF